MIHDKRSIKIGCAIAGAMLLAGWFFVVWGLVMATGAQWL
jgi:hypothetical protein